MEQVVLALDAGTTSVRVIAFTARGEQRAISQMSVDQSYPQPGWVEQDPEAIWQASLQCLRAVFQALSQQTVSVTALGISNQRETSVVWNRDSGQPIYPAIGWQDRRTLSACEKINQSPEQTALIKETTGLVLDPYFSATKITWMLDHVEGARQAAEAGQLAFGTIDSFLLWRLTDGKVHATDRTNASRTALYHIHQCTWDSHLLALFNIPAALLPEVKENIAEFGHVDPSWLGQSLPVMAMAGDQQAALVGQACLRPGMVKCTLGTGAFLLLNTGRQAMVSEHRLLTTIAYSIEGEVYYALEGSSFVAGLGIQWLRDNLHLIESAAQSEVLARSVTDNGGVFLVPAFTGLGAPHWNAQARAAIMGLGLESSAAHIVRAGLESVGYQVCDIVQAMRQDTALAMGRMRLDGGMINNRWLLQFMADILGCEIQRASSAEATARGVAWMAAYAVGMVSDWQNIHDDWQVEESYFPVISERSREKLYRGWLAAVASVGVFTEACRCVDEAPASL